MEILRPKKRLHRLDPFEVSLVREGANLRKFLIQKKRDTTQGDDMPTTADMIDEMRRMDAPTQERVQAALAKLAGRHVIEKDLAGVDGAATTGLSNRAQAALKAVARILAPFKDEITDSDLDQIQEAVGISGVAAEDDGDNNPGDVTGDSQPSDMEFEPPASPGGELSLADDEAADGPEVGKPSPRGFTMAKPKGVADEHHAGALTAAKSAYVDSLNKTGYKLKNKAADKPAAKQGSASMPAAINKSADGKVDVSAFAPEQREQLQAIFKSHEELADANKELIQKNTELTTSLASLSDQVRTARDEQAMARFKAEAAGLNNLGAKTDELAGIFKTLEDQSPELRAKVQTILKSVNEQVRVAKSQGGDLFAEYGSKLGDTGGAESADAKLNALVDSAVLKSEKGMTREQIYQHVVKNTAEGKALFRQAAMEGSR